MCGGATTIPKENKYSFVHSRFFTNGFGPNGHNWRNEHNASRPRGCRDNHSSHFHCDHGERCGGRARFLRQRPS